MILFEWDEVKAATNKKKHGVEFEVATQVFEDPYALTRQDRIENGEYRWQTVGLVEGLLILLVAHTVREQKDDEIIRIISARPTTRKERKEYEQNRQKISL